MKSGLVRMPLADFPTDICVSVFFQGLRWARLYLDVVCKSVDEQYFSKDKTKGRVLDDIAHDLQSNVHVFKGMDIYPSFDVSHSTPFWGSLIEHAHTRDVPSL